MTNLYSILKSRDITLPTEVYVVKAMVFPVVMYVCQSWTIKKAECQRIDALNCGVGKDSWESLGQQEIKPVNPKWNQSWLFLKRTDSEVEAPPDGKSPLIRKDPDAWKGWRQEEKGMTEDEMIGWHNWLNEHELEKVPEDGEGQKSLACCSPWGHKISDMTEWLNNNNNNPRIMIRLPALLMFFSCFPL